MPNQELPQPTDDARFQFCPETGERCKGEECAKWVSMPVAGRSGRLEGGGPAVTAVVLQNILLVLIRKAGY